MKSREYQVIMIYVHFSFSRKIWRSPSNPANKNKENYDTFCPIIMEVENGCI